MLNVVTVFKNLIIGIIVAIYLLASRKKFAQQAKLILYSILKPRWADTMLNEVLYADKMFGGFINGKIMDSAIIGVLCYIVCAIVKFPSALLVSVIIGVTNVIPFFGPFIGAVPATLLILIQSPIKALWFVLFILILQQLDGNVIGPKILGNSTGLSSFWVLFAILLFGGLWGFVGMIIGVPLFAVIYDVVKKLVIHGLRRNDELEMLGTYHETFGDPEEDIPVPYGHSPVAPGYNPYSHGLPSNESRSGQFFSYLVRAFAIRICALFRNLQRLEIHLIAGSPQGRAREKDNTCPLYLGGVEVLGRIRSFGVNRHTEVSKFSQLHHVAGGKFQIHRPV